MMWLQSNIFSIHYSSSQCHMILQKSFKYDDFLLKKCHIIIINAENSCAA